MFRHRSTFPWLRGTRIILLLLFVLGLSGLGAARPVRAAEDADHPADVMVSVWPQPNILVTPGTTIDYEIRARNYGSEEASRVRVRLEYDPNQLAVVTTSFEDGKDWVRSLGSADLEVQFGAIDEEAGRAATVVMRVNEAVPYETVINVWASFYWTDTEGNTEIRPSNATPIVVAAGNQSSPWVWMAVEPRQGPAGTSFGFFSDRFVPNEDIATWMNTPGGVQALPLRKEADDHGRIWLDFSSSGLAPGTYQMVASGTQSKITAVETFVVEP